MNIYLNRIKKNKLFLLLVFISILLFFIAFFGEHFAPNDPYKMNYEHTLEKGSKQFPMGTDSSGRCLFSRILSGGKKSVLIMFLVVIITSVFGTVIGVISGISGGFIDTLIMRIVDMLLAFPGLIFTIALIGFLGINFWSLVISMSAFSWLEYARISRGLTLDIKNSNYIAEAKLGGARNSSLIKKYYLPNLAPHILVLITQNLGTQLLVISSLSLLGLGSQPPTPEWGSMLSKGKIFMQQAPWLLYYPGLVILIYAIVFNLLGDSLRDILDPKEVAAKKKKGGLFI